MPTSDDEMSRLSARAWVWTRDTTFSPKPITGTAPHRTTGLQIITGNYWLTTAHCREITGLYMTLYDLAINDVYRYQRFTDKAGLFTADYRW